MANSFGWRALVINLIAFVAFDLVSVCGKIRQGHFILRYDFEQINGTRQVIDRSGNGRNATMDTDITSRPGICGEGISLDTEYLRVNTERSSEPLNSQKFEVSIAVWIFFNNETRGQRTIFTSFHSNETAKEKRPFLYFGIKSDNMLKFSATSGEAEKNTFKPVFGNSTLKSGVWQHVAVSYTFANGDESCFFFVNGSTYQGKHMEKKTTQNMSVDYPPLGHTAFIGSNNDEDKPFVIDQLYMFNSALFPNEIPDLLNCTRTANPTVSKTEPTMPPVISTTTKMPTVISTTTKMPSVINTTTKSHAERVEQWKGQARNISNLTEAKTFFSGVIQELFLIKNTSETQSDGGLKTLGRTRDLEDIGLILAQKALNASKSIELETTSTFLLMKRPLAGFTFPHTDQQKAKGIRESISFPDDMVKSEDGGQRAFVCLSYSNLHERLPREVKISSGSFKPNTTLTLNSKIIGCAVKPALERPLTNPINITFSHAKISSGKQVCAFWNHSLRTTDGQNGSWSTSGCKVDEEQSTSTKTVCLCNHLTNFALLLQREGTSHAEMVEQLKARARNINNPTEAKTFLSGVIQELFPNRDTSETPSDGGRKSMGRTRDLEDIGLILARALNAGESVELETTSTFLLMKLPLAGFTFPHTDQQNAKGISESISFPDDMVKAEGGVQRAFVCLSYSNLEKRLPHEVNISSGSFKPNTTLTLNSKIIGSAVEPALERPLTNPIRITFSHEISNSSGKQVCSFWNHTLRTTDGQYGSWSTSGCKVDEEQSTSTKTVCLCNHLTNFALLLQREGTPHSDPPLSLKIITIIGCSLSILACVVCFIMFFTLRKKDIRHYLHINLTFAIAVSQLILLFGLTQTKYEILCKTMAVCLHYFYLVAFLLMLCEGVHLAILIETAFLHGEMKLPAYLITSWERNETNDHSYCKGWLHKMEFRLPLIIVGITLGARFDNYGGDIACFISADQGTVYAFVGPFGLILLINFVILVIVLRQVIRKTSLPISSKSASNFAIAKATIRSLAILFPVMGFTWIFGILYFAFRSLALEYLFAIFCSLQGFFIFVFQYALNTENRLAFVRAMRRWRQTLTSSTHTSANRAKQTGAIKANVSPPDSDGKNDEVHTSTVDNCHLMLYRNADDSAGGTIDSRTQSTFI